MNAFTEWQEQRTVCNIVFNEWLLELASQKK